MITVLQKKTLLLEKEGDNLKVWSIIQFDFQITMKVSKKLWAKKGNPDEYKIGLERVVASIFDKGMEEGIL